MSEEQHMVLEVKDLSVCFCTRQGDVQAVNHVSFQLHRGEILGIVGESGCGKSVTANSIMGLIGRKKHEKVTGSVRMDRKELLTLSEVQMNQLRGDRISMIFQDPMTTLNPLLQVGYQVAETLRVHKKTSWKSARAQTEAMLKKVGIPNAKERYSQYPFSFSGGMRQRAIIASALLCKPEIIIADEPTTALDVTIQAQILDLLRRMRDEYHASVLLITHDLGVVAETCDTVVVMYAGEVMERAPVGELFARPLHPYTQGLLRCLPRLGNFDRLVPIPGQPPVLIRPDKGCRFRDRCPYAVNRCADPQQERTVGQNHIVQCWKGGNDDSGT